MFVVLFFLPSISSQDYFSCRLLLLFSLLVVSELCDTMDCSTPGFHVCPSPSTGTCSSPCLFSDAI